MADNLVEVVRLSLTPNAESQARDYINKFTTSLLIQAKTIAYRRGADIVSSNHVIDAQSIIFGEHRQSRTQLLSIFGGAVIGASIQGIFTELSLLPMIRPLWVVVYVALGFFGVFLVSWGFVGRN